MTPPARTTAAVPAPPGTALPFSFTAPADVNVHLLPPASVRVPPEAAVISLLTGLTVGAEIGAGVGLGVGAGVGAGVDASTGAAEAVQLWLVVE